MLRNLEFLGSKLGKVEGYGTTGEYLVELVKSKQVMDESRRASDAKDEAEEKPGDEKKEGEDEDSRAAKP
jgi:vacuolar protein sorting-associated protein 54